MCCRLITTGGGRISDLIAYKISKGRKTALVVRLGILSELVGYVGWWMYNGVIRCWKHRSNL
jgi:hypothetical protein